MPELKDQIEELGRAFTEFKAANDQQMAEIKKSGSADPLLAEKVEKINASITSLQAEKDRLDKLEAAMNRGEFGGGNHGEVKAKKEHEAAFNNYFRKGVDSNLRDLEVQAALTTQVDEDGGFTVTEEMDSEISRELEVVSAMRSVARVMTIGAKTFKRWHSVGGAGSGWVGEEEAREETSTPKLKELVFEAMMLYAEPVTTQDILDDSGLNIAAWLSGEVGIEFAEQEGIAFISGNGVKKPRGLLAYPTVAHGTQSFGQIGFIASGASGAFAASNPADKLIDLEMSLKAGYRSNAKWMMNDLTQGSVRKLKDSEGNYLWRPGLEPGAPAILLGKEVVSDDNMPDIAANSLSIAFGDFNRGYLIVDRAGVRVLRDDLTKKGFVKYYTTKRVGGGVNNSEAIKLMKFAS